MCLPFLYKFRGSMRDTGVNTMSTTAAEEFLQRKSTAVSVSESDFDKYTVSTSASMERNISVESEVRIILNVLRQYCCSRMITLLNLYIQIDGNTVKCIKYTSFGVHFDHCTMLFVITLQLYRSMLWEVFSTAIDNVNYFCGIMKLSKGHHKCVLKFHNHL